MCPAYQYGTTVSESSPEIRATFVRKVYTILGEAIPYTVIAAH